MRTGPIPLSRCGLNELEFRVKYVYPCGMFRSGTTLLATTLDSHPRISMAYELIPARVPPIPELIELIQTAYSGSTVTESIDTKAGR